MNGEAGDNGAQPDPPATPPKELELFVTLKMKMTPLGMALDITHSEGMFADSVIDMCSRAIRFFERVALIQHMGQAQAAALKHAKDVQRIIPASGRPPLRG